MCFIRYSVSLLKDTCLLKNTILKKCGVALSDDRLSYENMEYVREKIITHAKENKTEKITTKELQNG